MKRGSEIRFEVYCDNAKSYSIRPGHWHDGKGRGVTVLVRCDRLDKDANVRGSELAEKIVKMLNALPEDERKRFAGVM